MGVGVGVGVGLVGKWLYDTWQESQTNEDYKTDTSGSDNWYAEDDASASFQAQTDESVNEGAETLNTQSNQVITDTAPTEQSSFILSAPERVKYFETN